MRDLYAELAEYTGRDLTLVTQRCVYSAAVELAWQWEKYKDDPIKFYRETDLYIFALTYYQMRLKENKIDNWFQYMIKKHGWKTGLDYGGGIGEETLLALEQGVERMTFIEIARSKTLEYAMWRFKKSDLSGQIVIENENFPIDFAKGMDWDFVVAMDVFEHLEDPEPVIKAIHKHTEWLFCNPDQIKYNWLAPQHISKFDLTPYFKHVDLYLWRRK